MSAKFEGFKAALAELCLAHHVRLRDGDDHDDYGIYVEELFEHEEALSLDLTDRTVQSPEDIAAAEERDRERSAFYEAQWKARAAERAEQEKHFAEMLASDDSYIRMRDFATAHATQQRKKLMRVSTDPNDPAYVDDRPRKVWHRGVEVEDWVVADEFRRVIQTSDGRVINGDVRVERLPGVGEPVVEVAQSAPIDTGFIGMFEAVPTPAPVAVQSAPERQEDSLDLPPIEGVDDK